MESITRPPGCLQDGRRSGPHRMLLFAGHFHLTLRLKSVESEQKEQLISMPEIEPGASYPNCDAYTF